MWKILSDHIKKSPHRNLLERHINRVFPTLKGPILEIGSKNRRYDQLLSEAPTAVDIIPNEEKNVQQGDVTSLHFPANTFTTVLCMEVLEYVTLPDRAVSEMRRVLSPGGTLVLSVPFMFKVHEDRLRYTPHSLKELLSQFDIVSFEVVGGSYTVVMTILWGKIKSIPFLPLRYFLTILLLPFVLIQYLFHHGEQYASGYFIVATKKYG